MKTLRLLALALLAFPCRAAETLDAKALIREIETSARGKTSHALAEMRIKTEFWERSLMMEMWGEGRERFLAVIRSPKKERGTGTLKRDEEVWNFLPKIDRLIKVPSSLMGDSWMGSHITNDDLVKEDKIEVLFDLSILSRSGDTAVISAVPKPNAAVVWGKIVYHADLARRVALSVEYFDEDGAKVRTMTFDRVETVAGRSVPMRIRVVPVGGEGEFTEILYKKLELDIPLEKGLFTVRSLRRRR
ncbi:MAG: outer membrane lipoprotein-sorting protein [Elusimicrobia bacterium]|nr:outer membrane lipoprotein-sorting protein [Elusimicrobiota bacterium]